jgi:hypothetical protein
MNAGSSDRHGRPWLRQAGAAAVAGIALLVTACGGGGSAATSTGPPTLQSLTAQALAYAKCMRGHGISGFPDPTVQDNAHSKGVGFSMPSGVDTHSQQFQSASKLCQKQTGFGHISTAQLQQGMNAMLKYAECMRSHGITSFPDPFENSHQIGFNLTDTGIDQNSPRFKAANKTCQPLMPGGGP